MSGCCLDQHPPSTLNIKIILGCVCRYWWEVVQSIPALETIITLSPLKFGWPLMEMYISRSAFLPLSLRIDFSRAETDFSMVEDLYDTIAGRVSRLSIQHLEMGPNYLDFWHLLSCIPLPNLTTLVIPCIVPNILLHFFEAIHAPNLQTVTISTFKHLPPQYWHPLYYNLPVDPLYLAYEMLDHNTSFQVRSSFTNSFSKVADLGFIRTPEKPHSRHCLCSFII